MYVFNTVYQVSVYEICTQVLHGVVMMCTLLHLEYTLMSLISYVWIVDLNVDLSIIKQFTLPCVLLLLLLLLQATSVYVLASL